MRLPGRPCLRSWAAIGVLAGTLLAAGTVGSTDPNPGSAVLWGRIVLDEESPDGPVAPQAGVEVRLVPVGPGLLETLDAIRRGARTSGQDYEAAVKRALDALGWRDLPPGGAPASSSPGTVARRVTDPDGIFLFEEVPPGAWLVVGLRLSPLGRGLGDPSARRGTSRPGAFLTGAPRPARRAELWLSPIQVTAGERRSVLWSDRSRFLMGPLP